MFKKRRLVLVMKSEETATQFTALKNFQLIRLKPVWDEMEFPQSARLAVRCVPPLWDKKLRSE